jgi:hypothetical protein
MAGDPLAKGQPGDRISARTFNVLVDAARVLKSRAVQVGADVGRLDPGGTVLVRNETSAVVPRFGVLGLGVPIIEPSMTLSHFQSRVTFEAHQPSAADVGRFVILQEPLAAGAIGRGVVSGVTIGKVWVTAAQLPSPPKRAEVATDETSSLDLTDTGTAEVLYQETVSAEGEAWAILRLGTATGAGGGTGTDPDASATVRGYVSLNNQTLGDGGKTFQKPILIRGGSVAGYIPEGCTVKHMSPASGGGANAYFYTNGVPQTDGNTYIWEYQHPTPGIVASCSVQAPRSDLGRPAWISWVAVGAPYGTGTQTANLRLWASRGTGSDDKPVLELTGGSAEIRINGAKVLTSTSGFSGTIGG